jgi:4-amino-4-deoxy-L-arabinose transferase-like glycosyltransferase
MTALERIRSWLRAQPAWWPLGAVLLLAFALRLVWVLYAAREPQELHDPFFYVLYGDRISNGDGYTLLNGEPTAYYPVGYPAALGGVFALIKQTFIPDNRWFAAGFFQIFLGVGTAGLAYYSGRRLFGPAVGLIAALWIALFPNLIFHTATYLSETLFNFLVMASLAVLVAGWRRDGLGTARLLLFGAVLGLSVLVRPISLLFLPALALVLLLAGAGWRRSLAQTAIAVVPVLAILMPWAVRNFVVMEAPIVISANLGDDLCMGHHPNAPGHFALPQSCFGGYEHLARPEYEVQRNEDNIRRAVNFAIDHPAYEVELIVKKARWTYDHDHDGLWAVESYGDDPFLDPVLRSRLSRLADGYFFATLAFGAAGLVAFGLARGDPRTTFLLLATLALGAVPLAFFGDARFHVPAMPLLSLAAAWTAVAAAGSVPKLLQARKGERPGTSRVEVAEAERPVPEQDAL